MSTSSNGEKKKFSFFFGFNSIRSRYSLVTAVFLFSILTMFYIGGRIVLVHLVRDTEHQVQDIGFAVNGFVKKDAQRIHDVAVKLAKARERIDPQTTKELLGLHEEQNIAFSLHLDQHGRFVDGCLAGKNENESVKLNANDLEPYADTFSRWVNVGNSTNAVRSAGIISMRGHTYQCAIVRHDQHYLVLGSPFNLEAFSVRMNASLGHPIHIAASKNGAVPSAMIVKRAVPEYQPRANFDYGLAPMLSEAINFYSGGFWRFEGDPLEAAFALRDIAGHPIAQIVVSLPKSFANVTANALDRLTFCVAIIGLLLIAPIFWLQCHAILNPLSKMIKCIREVSEHRKEVDCPRIDWKGNDEFAQLADCVNTLLETISRRTIDIEQSAKRQHALIDGIPDGLLIFDSKCRLVYVFKQPEGGEPIPGLAERQELDRNVWGESNHKAFGTLIKQSFADHSRHGLILKVAMPNARGADAIRNFDVRTVPMDNHFALVLFRDVSAQAREERRRLSELERDSQFRKQESLSIFAAGIAHDVKNILSIVLNTTEIYWQEHQDEQSKGTVTTIRDAVHRGTDMMRELMAFAGESRMTLKPSTPTDLISGAESLARALVGDRIVIDFDVPYGLPAVDADPTQMWKVFFNIIKNAVESMGDNPGEIHVSAARYMMLDTVAETFKSSNPLAPGPGIMFRITDNGPGMPADVLHRIFDPYISTKGTGRGLGLSIVYATVDAHGGGIRVRSIVGHGTTFEIFLPLSSHQAVPTATGSTQPAGTATPAAGNDVLVVDDDPAILRTTTVLLRFLKLNAHVAGDRHTSLLKFRKYASTLSCVLLDAHIASFSTVRVLEAMRIIAPNVPVIVTSGSAEHTIQDAFANVKYDAFLAKPYTLDEFKTVLAKIHPAK